MQEKHCIKLPSGSVYEVKVKHKWFSYLDLALISKISHNIYTNTPKCKKKKIQNPNHHLSQTFLVRDNNLYEALDGLRLKHSKRMEPRSSAWQRFCWEGEELSCTCVVMAVCVSTHCHFTCFVLCAQNSELYVMCILQQYKTTKHLAICLPYLYAGKGKEQAHYGGQNLLPDTKQSCSLVSVPVRCRHEAKSKGQQR